MVPEPLPPLHGLPGRAASGGRSRVLVAAIAALVSLSLCNVVRAAETYVCTDRSGHTIAGPEPPPECRDRDVRVLNPDGSLKRIIPAPLTQEQRRKRDAEEELRMRQEESERAQARRDRALLETYSNVDEIDSARKRSLAGRQMLIDRADQRIAQYEKERKRLDDEAEFYVNRELPLKLKDAFEANKALVEQQEKTRADAQLEMKRINERFDAERRRYMELEEMAAEAAEARRREAKEQE
jgi:hypothetical protein